MDKNQNSTSDPILDKNDLNVASYRDYYETHDSETRISKWLDEKLGLAKWWYQYAANHKWHPRVFNNWKVFNGIHSYVPFSFCWAWEGGHKWFCLVILNFGFEIYKWD